MPVSMDAQGPERQQCRREARFLRQPPTRGPLFNRALTAVMLALALLLPSLARADDYDRWYAVDLAGQRAGWMHASQYTAGDRITTRNEVAFELGRGQVQLSVSIKASFIESAAGKPIAMDATLKLGATPTLMHAVYTEQDIQVDITKAGKTTHSTRPLPDGTWLTPAAATSFVRQRLLAGAVEMTVRAIDPGGSMDDPTTMLEPSVITRRDCRPATVEALGKTVKVTRCITTTSTQPGVESTEYLDELGVPVKTELSLGAIPIVATAADRSEALAKHPGAEMMVSTLVKPDRAILNARETRRAVYLLSVPDGKIPALPSTASQKAESLAEKKARLTIDVQHPASAPETDLKDATFTAPSQTIDSDDEKVKSLAKRATEGLGPNNKPKRAEAMRLFVHRYINKKSLGVGFASASETARTREGDCTEHGVLLAALLRADGIPARVVCGLVYADQFAGASEIFGYHMWTQALLEIDGTPRWVDLDATLDPNRPFDATHIALAVSSLAEGQSTEALMSIAQIIGRLGIKVESVE
jgi:transglutaminase-like putative cysteine protease